MSFSSQALSSKRQRFDDSENEERAREHPTKRKRIDWSEDQEREDSADYDSEGYVPLPPNPKVTDRPSNLGAGTRSVTHLVSI